MGLNHRRTTGRRRKAAPDAHGAEHARHRGQRYDDAERETDYFLDRMTRERGAVLHRTAGTGETPKTGLRRFLKSDARVKTASPASHDDGGDAYDVELRRSCSSNDVIWRLSMYRREAAGHAHNSDIGGRGGGAFLVAACRERIQEVGPRRTLPRG